MVGGRVEVESRVMHGRRTGGALKAFLTGKKESRVCVQEACHETVFVSPPGYGCETSSCLSPGK